MEYLRAYEIADAGDNFLHLMLPSGSKLKIVNVKNATSPWLVTSSYVTRPNAEEQSPDTISLKDRIIQCGLKDVHWEGDLNLSIAYSRVEAKIEGCTVGDVIALTVGFDI